MRRDKERLVIVIVTLCYLVCQNGVTGNTLRVDKVEDDKNKEARSVGEADKISAEYIDDTETLYEDTSDFKTRSDSDTTTFNKRIQEMPLKLGLQFLTAKFGLSESLDKAKQGGNHIYHGARNAVNTMTDFIGDGIGNARYLLFGSK